MKSKIKLIAVISAMALAFTAFGCKTDTETEWKDKTYCSAVIFTSQATEDGVKVTMETSTEGASIYYTTDGTVPTEKSTKYSEPVEFKKDATVKAIAIKKGLENSPVSVATVSIKEKTITETKIEYIDKTYCSAVNFTSQATEDGVKVTMETSTEGASIYYTTDGTAPTAESKKYSESVEFTKDATVKAIAVKTGIENSPVSVATVSIKEKTIIETKIEYVDKTYCSAVTFTSQPTEDGVKVTMETSTEGASIYYTTDGTAPTAESKKYSESVEFTKDATVKAIAVKTGIENSPVSVATVSIKEKTIIETKTEYVDKTYCSAVTFMSQATEDGVKVTMETSTEGAAIYYTTDGTIPTEKSTKYSEPVEFTKDATVKVIAVKTGIENSPVSVATVSIKEKTVEVDQQAGETMKIALTAVVPQENGYTGNKSKTKVTVTANITTASSVKKVVWKKDGSINAKRLLADEDAAEATVTEDNAVWTFDITAADESANGTYTVAAIDEAGREEAEQITIDSFDFTAPGKVKVTSKEYSSESATIKIRWTEPEDSDYDHVDITFTSNDGTANSEPIKAETVNKGTTEKTFSSIDGAKAYYTCTFVTYDELGNKGAEYKYRVYVNIISVSEGFVVVKGTTINGTENWIPSSKVFVSGRQITIPDLIVCDHEVTRGEYKDVVGSDPSTASAYDKDGNELTGDDVLNNPVNYVNWYNALVYCNKLSIKESLKPCYTIIGYTDPAKWGKVPTSSNSTWNKAVCDFDADGYRLPTDAEWEWLARGGENYTYAGSNTVEDVAWYKSNTSYTGTREVKTKQANGYGLYDMSGNVFEWCWDWYNSSISSSTDAAGAASGSSRVQRGGSWFTYGSLCEVDYRHCNDPGNRYNDYGFRVVRSAY